MNALIRQALVAAVIPLLFLLALHRTSLAQPAKTPSSALVAPDAFTWGVNGHPLGGGGVYSEHRGVTLAEQVRLIRHGGFDWYRCDVAARDRVPGVWEHSDELDIIVPAMEIAGIRLYPTLHAPHELRPFETLPQRYSSDEIYRLCFDHARQAAAKWRGRIRVWDLSNETDGWTIRHGDGNRVEHYDPALIDAAAALLRGQADGIRAGDPDAVIALNVGGWLHTAFVDLMIEKGLRFDILDWHWYSEMGSINSIAHRNDYNLLEKLLSYGKPLWFGEVNARPGVTDPPAETWLLGMMKLAHDNRHRGVEALFVYELLDIPPAEHATTQQALTYAGYGLVAVERFTDPNFGGITQFRAGPPRPLFNAVRNFIHDAKPARPDGG